MFLKILIICVSFILIGGKSNGNNTACNDELEFTCSDGTCIPLEDRCNDVNDCPQGEDEDECPTCDGFQCENGVCLNFDKHCDRVADCSNGEDEEFCNEGSHECADYEITCDDKCIPILIKCDGVPDCKDGTDELNCPTDRPIRIDVCQENEYQCSDLNCIDEHDRCNGIQDCADNSDELNCPTVIPDTTQNNSTES